MIDNCEAYKFNTNNKQINLKFFNISNIQKLLITDKYILDCSESSLEKCGDDSNICQKYDLSYIPNNFSIQFSTKMCLNSIIVYMIKGNTAPVVKPNINTTNSNSTNNNITINTTNTIVSISPQFFVFSNYSTENCGYTHQSAMGYCGESSIDDCKNCKWSGCNLIQCGNNVKKEFVKKYDLCVPNILNDNEKLKKCLNFADVTTFSSTLTCEDNSLEGYSFITIFIIGIIVIAVLVLSITVIYYNICLVKYKAAPFIVPDFCPEFLFPRDNMRDELGETDRNLKAAFSEDSRKNFNLLDK